MLLIEALCVKGVGILIFTIGVLIYIFSCFYIAKLNVNVRSHIKGKIVLEYISAIVFIALYIPYSFFFPTWLSEYLSVWERTSDITAIMILFGVVVSALAMLKAGRINAT